MLASAALLALALWAGFSLLLWALQEQMIFFPRTLDTADRARLSEHALEAEASDGTNLAGWAIPAEDATTAALYFGGNGEEISYSLGELSRELGTSVAGLNYRGYGDSKGRPSAAALRADALVAFDAAAERLGIPPERMFVVGRSLGSHMAAHVAANREVAGLVLVTPFDSVENVAARRYAIFPVRLMIRHRFDTLAETADITAQTLVLRVDGDYVVPDASTDRLLEGWAGKGPVDALHVPGVGHNDIDRSEAYWGAIRALVSPEASEPAAEAGGN